MRHAFGVAVLCGSALLATDLSAQTAADPKIENVQESLEQTLDRSLREIQQNIERKMAELERRAADRHVDADRLARNMQAPPRPPAVPRVPAVPAVQRDSQRSNGPTQTEHFSRKIKLGNNGSFSISNVSGDIVITAGSGDQVSIEATKSTQGTTEDLAAAEIVVDERAGRVDVRTEYPRGSANPRRNTGVSVDYQITVPSSASVDVHSVSGNVKVTGVQGAVRAGTVSGSLTAASLKNLTSASAVSGDVTLTGAGTDADLRAASVSGNVRANGLKARGLEVESVSGQIVLSDVSCERLTAKSISGNVEYSGTLTSAGRYDINTHSGTVRLTLPSSTGFEFNASTFSGSIRSDLPLTLGGDRGEIRTRGGNNRTIRATFANGSAALNVRTFSGDIVITKR